MKRRLALWLLGIWAMGTLAIALVATRNFGVVDQLLEQVAHPIFGGIVDQLGAASSRELLRYLASEVNRTLFDIWGWVQIPLGAGVVWLVWDQVPHRVRYLALVMLALVLVLTFGLTPPIIAVGRELDFVPRDPAPPALATFGVLHAAYSVAEFAKLGIGLLVAYWLIKD